LTDGRTASRAGTRVVGIDLGERRIGVSVSDSKRTLATPHSVITRAGDPAADRRAIAGLASELGAGLVVIGLPLTLAGSKGTAASSAETEASALAAELGVPVVLQDERLTTVEAERRRRIPEQGRVPGVARARRRTLASAASRARRVPVDAVAATVLLQAWLDKNRGES
jgi:putative Holliday junction resolvase